MPSIGKLNCENNNTFSFNFKLENNNLMDKGIIKEKQKFQF